jgi:hypothetical protein
MGGIHMVMQGWRRSAGLQTVCFVLLRPAEKSAHFMPRLLSYPDIDIYHLRSYTESVSHIEHVRSYKLIDCIV